MKNSVKKETTIRRKNSIDDLKNVQLQQRLAEEEEDTLPDVDELNQKYGLVQKKMPDENTIRYEMKQGSELIDKTEALIKKLARKDQEIEKLCVLLETLEPIPGISVENMRKHLDNNVEDGADFRDAKIVSIAKKNRNLTVMLNKERASADSRGIQLQELTSRFEQLEKSGGVRKDSSDKDSQQDVVQMKRELHASNKIVEELRRKIFQAVEESKQLSRALTNEVGDGVTIEKAVEGSWRGRAQQIIMLKAKIKKMESAGPGTVN
jgi:hypothetical protein